MKRDLISPTDRDELSRLVAGAIGAVDIRRIVLKVSMLSPPAIHEVERLLRCVGTARVFRLYLRGGFGLAPVLMFNRNGYIRETVLKAIHPLPDTPFFLAALVWRLSDWVEPVRRAAEECANRELPRLSTRTIVETAPFLLERMAYWGRWGLPVPSRSWLELFGANLRHVEGS